MPNAANEALQHPRRPERRPALVRDPLVPATERRTILLIGPPDASQYVEALRTDPRLVIDGPIAPALSSKAYPREAYDAAVLDVDVGDAAFDVVLQLAEAEQPCRCVVLGSNLDRTMVREVFFGGVMACLRKPVAPSVLAGVLQQACDATMVMRQCIASANPGELASLDRRAVDTSTLTKREREILQLLLEGATTQTMADELAVTPRTVKFHVSNLLRKLGAGSRLSLLAKIRRADAW